MTASAELSTLKLCSRAVASGAAEGDGRRAGRKRLVEHGPDRGRASRPAPPLPSRPEAEAAVGAAGACAPTARPPTNVRTPISMALDPTRGRLSLPCAGGPNGEGFPPRRRRTVTLAGRFGLILVVGGSPEDGRWLEDALRPSGLTVTRPLAGRGAGPAGRRGGPARAGRRRPSRAAAAGRPPGLARPRCAPTPRSAASPLVVVDHERDIERFTTAVSRGAPPACVRPWIPRTCGRPSPVWRAGATKAGRRSDDGGAAARCCCGSTSISRRPVARRASSAT